MSIEAAPFSPDEKTLLVVLKSLYWKTNPPTKCPHNKAISSEWPGYPVTSQQLDSALRSLLSQGCLSSDGAGAYCLTDIGLREIGALPALPDAVD